MSPSARPPAQPHLPTHTTRAHTATMHPDTAVTQIPTSSFRASKMALSALLVLAAFLPPTDAFVPQRVPRVAAFGSDLSHRPTGLVVTKYHSPSVLLHMANKQDADSQPSPSCWNPPLRKTMGAISSFGMVETAYLTFTKLFSSDGTTALCGSGDAAGIGGGGSCADVLDGPYASVAIGGSEVPLAAFGFAAYTIATGLAVFPLMLSSGEGGNDTGEGDLDSSNRITLIATTTAMATFSSFLMSVLFGVLHATCPFCVASAILSISLGVLSWSSDMVPEGSKKLGGQATFSSFGMATVVALALFFSADVPATAAPGGDNSFSSSLIASTAKLQQEKDVPPPPITSHSSQRSLKLADDLKSLDARMFGAYWCSHCYEQKQRMGLEAMQRIPYIECAKEGLNSQKALCNARDVPGYPTWEVGGKLFPGEQDFDELEDIVKEVRGNKSS